MGREKRESREKQEGWNDGLTSKRRKSKGKNDSWVGW